MSTVHFTTDHEYVRVEGDIATIGITNYAQEQLGDVVFVELPEAGRQLTRGDETAVVESVKAASEINAPVSGEVIEANTAIEETPATINQDPLGAGWFVKIRISDQSELGGMMDEAAYESYIKEID